jgi:hypothetical protein
MMGRKVPVRMYALTPQCHSPRRPMRVDLQEKSAWMAKVHGAGISTHLLHQANPSIISAAEFGCGTRGPLQVHH